MKMNFQHAGGAIGATYILPEIKAHKTTRFKKIEPIFHGRKRDP